MQRVTQSPIDPGFVQNPYGFYDSLYPKGDLVFWTDYDLPCAVSHRAVQTVLRDKRFGREVPPEMATPPPAHLRHFYAVDHNSMLELEPPRHTRLRALVLRAFTSRRIAALGPEITQLSHDLIDTFPDAPFDLITRYAQHIPVIVICRLLGVPEALAPQLLQWSSDMVAMYQARRDLALERRADTAAKEFTDLLRATIAQRRAAPQDDLLSHLIAARDEGGRLSEEELCATCILLLNAGHEATVHAIGNAVRRLLLTGLRPQEGSPQALIDELLRLDPPLHMFTRYAYEKTTLFDHTFERGDQVALLLGAANRDPKTYPNPSAIDPARSAPAHTGFGGGIHFCVGAPLARLEMQIALPILFQRCPNLRLTTPPTFANLYHFHGVSRLMVQA